MRRTHGIGMVALTAALVGLWQTDVVAWKVYYGDCGAGGIYVKELIVAPSSPTSHEFEFIDKWDTLKVVVVENSLDFPGAPQFAILMGELQDAASTWDTATDELRLSVVDNLGSRFVDPLDGVNVIAWTDTIEGLGANSANTVATTLLTVKTGTAGQCDTGLANFAEVVDVDILFNDDYIWRSNKFECGGDPNDANEDEQDIASIAVHEMGHALRIAHTNTTSGCPSMLGQCGSCESTFEDNLGMRSLASDDESAAGFLYDTTNSVKSEQGNDATKRVALATIPVLPQTASISAAYPNPFNPSIVVEYELGAEGSVRLEVYNGLGQSVRTLLDEEHRLPGFYQETWDGRDDAGLAVASGVYILRLSARDDRISRRITLAR